MRAHVLNLYPFHNCNMKFKYNLMIWQEGNVRCETENNEQLLNARCSNRQTVISYGMYMVQITYDCLLPDRKIKYNFKSHLRHD